MKVNGKEYNMWGQFVERQNEWVGNILEDFDMGMYAATTITGISLEPNGEDSAYFTIKGKEFDCGFDVRYGGVGAGDNGYITFAGYGGHTFRIKNNNNNNETIQ